MTDPIYFVRLAEDLYLDNHGVLHKGAFPPRPSYTLPGEFFMTSKDASKFAKTLGDIGGALPNKSDTKRFPEFEAKLKEYGVVDEFIEVLGVVGNIADKLAKIFVVAEVGLKALEMLGLFGSGPSSLETLVKARFDALDKHIRALHALAVQQNLDDHRNAVIAARDTVESFVSQRDSGTLSVAEIESRLQTIVTDISLNSIPKFLSLLNVSSYMALFDSDEYQRAWPWIQTHLYRFPVSSPPVLASFPTMNAPVFDHRMAGILAPQAAQTFLDMVRNLSPEFRTTGDFRPSLRDFAEKLSNLAASIKNTSLARTVYYASDFNGFVLDYYVDDPLPGIIDPVLNPQHGIAVGAMDLCMHNDSAFSGGPKGGVWAGSVLFPGTSRHANIDFRWHLPAKLEHVEGFDGMYQHADGTPVRHYRIVNPQACADAANEQSLQDYSDLLITSGYMTLAHLATQLRHASTQPDKSETVFGDVLLQRLPLPRSEVMVTSVPGPVLFTPTGSITAQASREPQKIRAFASCSTQSLPRVKFINYRIFLRTLRSGVPPQTSDDPNYESVQTGVSPQTWVEPHYESVQWLGYINDPLHPGFQRLVLHDSPGSVLDEVLLIEGHSEVTLRQVNLPSIEMKAHTFDWWIPVKQRTASDHDFAASGGGHAFGVASAGAPLGPRRLPLRGGGNVFANNPAGAASAVLGWGWCDGAQSWEGHRRQIKETSVRMRVKLDWQGDKLRLAVENWPEDRNYVVFLVIEETFGAIEPDEIAPKVLHTAFPIPINGQLTYVPQSLFDEERASSDKLRDLANRFAISAVPRPGVPVFRDIQVGELRTEAGVMRLADALHQFEPELLEQLVTESKASP